MGSKVNPRQDASSLCPHKKLRFTKDKRAVYTARFAEFYYSKMISLKGLGISLIVKENEYRKLQALGVRIIEPPTKRPWGAVNMSFYDPDNNVIYFRQLQEE